MKDQILADIKIVFDAFSSHKEDPVALLADANRLSTLMYNLGDLYIAARENAELLGLAYKEATDKSFLGFKDGSGYTVEEAKSQARLDHADLAKQLAKAEIEVSELSTRRNDINTKISIIQSYCAELRERRRAEGTLGRA